MKTWGKTAPMFWYQMKKVLKPWVKRVLPTRLKQSIKAISANRPGDQQIEELFMEEWRLSRQAAGSIGANIAGGVNLVGYFRAVSGIGEAARSSFLALNHARVPLDLIDFEFDVPLSQQIDQSIPLLPGETFQYKANLLHVNPLQMPYLWERFGAAKLAGRYTIGVWYWEMPEFPAYWLSRFKVVDEIWVASDFVQQSVLPKSPVPVVKIPPCVHAEYDVSLTRADFGLPENVFLFLCAYDMRSMHQRKNPMGAIKAFCRAFRPADRSVGLVIKVNNAAENQQEMALLKQELTGYPNCFFIEKAFSRTQFNTLLHLIDAYISLHRSEGFGLVPAEAMLLGKPVVMTQWSGNVDYMTAENACGVDYRLTPVGPGLWPYQASQQWAEPDIEHAATYLQRLTGDRVYYANISANASRTIQTGYTQAVIGSQMRRRFEDIGLL